MGFVFCSVMCSSVCFCRKHHAYNVGWSTPFFGHMSQSSQIWEAERTPGGGTLRRPYLVQMILLWPTPGCLCSLEMRAFAQVVEGQARSHIYCWFFTLLSFEPSRRP